MLPLCSGTSKGRLPWKGTPLKLAFDFVTTASWYAYPPYTIQCCVTLPWNDRLAPSVRCSPARISCDGFAGVGVLMLLRSRSYTATVENSLSQELENFAPPS